MPTVEIKPLVEGCIGPNGICAHILKMNGEPIADPPTIETINQFRCAAYPNPSAWWRLGSCPLATHLAIVIQETGKKRVGQQKQKHKNR